MDQRGEIRKDREGIERKEGNRGFPLHPVIPFTRNTGKSAGYTAKLLLQPSYYYSQVRTLDFLPRRAIIWGSMDCKLVDIQQSHGSEQDLDPHTNFTAYGLSIATNRGLNQRGDKCHARWADVPGETQQLCSHSYQIRGSAPHTTVHHRGSDTLSHCQPEPIQGPRGR